MRKKDQQRNEGDKAGNDGEENNAGDGENDGEIGDREGKRGATNIDNNTDMPTAGNDLDDSQRLLSRRKRKVKTKTRTMTCSRIRFTSKLCVCATRKTIQTWALGARRQKLRPLVVRKTRYVPTRIDSVV